MRLRFHNKVQKSFIIGQIISKGLFDVFDFLKKRTKEFDFTTMIPQVDLFSFVFWRKSKTSKNHFEIILPLDQSTV